MLPCSNYGMEKLLQIIEEILDQPQHSLTFFSLSESSSVVESYLQQISSARSSCKVEGYHIDKPYYV